MGSQKKKLRKAAEILTPDASGTGWVSPGGRRRFELMTEPSAYRLQVTLSTDREVVILVPFATTPEEAKEIVRELKEITELVEEWAQPQHEKT